MTAWRWLACRLGIHETPELWEAPRETYIRRRELGRQNGLTYWRPQYRCKWCGRWYDGYTVRVDPPPLGWERPV